MMREVEYSGVNQGTCWLGGFEWVLCAASSWIWLRSQWIS